MTKPTRAEIDAALVELNGLEEYACDTDILGVWALSHLETIIAALEAAEGE